MMNMKAHGSEENYGIDRISSLPDDVRMHILSFLTTREAVQTCILSKRWINTWTFVLDLKFDIKDFRPPKFLDDVVAVEFMTKFNLFVKSVLEKRETSCVNRFQLRLVLGGGPCTQAIADCISDVMKLEPQECLVHIFPSKNLNLNTDIIFSCASLTDLQLWFSIDNFNLGAIKPNSVNLPSLKTIGLKGVQIIDDTLKNLLLGCPLLEELSLKDCSIGIIEIYSNTMKKLVLNDYTYIKTLQILTPNLLYFVIHIYLIKEIMLLNMPLLVDASIYICRWYVQNEYATMGPNLIHSLSNVERLQIKFNYINGEVQKKDFSSCSDFNNLKCLELVNMSLYDFDLAPYFLHHSPKLQELTLKYKHYCSMEYLYEKITQEGSKNALIQREFLKTVRIVGFRNDNGFVDQLINKLLVHVKIIGEIDIVQPDPCPRCQC